MHSRLVLLGRLTRDPETHNLPSGKSVCQMSLAIDCGWGDNRRTAFVDCKAWEKTGEVAQTYLRKGTPVLVDGRLDQEEWTDKTTGANRSKLVCVVERLTLLPKGGESSAQPAPTRQIEPREPYAPESLDDGLPF